MSIIAEAAINAEGIEDAAGHHEEETEEEIGNGAELKAKAIMVTDNWQFTFQNNIRELSIDAEAVSNEEEMKMLISMQKRICG